MTACATGCTLRSRHLTDCADQDTCRGCLPAPAAAPLEVCERCHLKLRHTLASAPALVRHIRGNVEPGATVRDDQPHAKGKKAPPAPLNVEALSAADDLHAELASWALLVMEERHITGPDWTGSDIRPASKRRTPAGIIYEDARVVGVNDWTATLTVSRWLLVHTEWMASQPWAADVCREIPEKVYTLSARWPTEQRPVYLPVPCPACNHQSLRRHAPKGEGLPVTVACEMYDCGHVIEEDGFDWAAKVLAKEQGAA